MQITARGDFYSKINAPTAESWEIWDRGIREAVLEEG